MGDSTASEPKSLKELFLAALEVVPPERTAWLDGQCSGDAELRRQLEDMLAAHEAPHSLLDQTVLVATAMVDQAAGGQPSSMKPGTQIGPYKLREQIGEGGFGVVYVAEQTQPVRRKVALKIIKPGMDTKEVIARFEAERQALALMDHPHVAKVLDAGTTEQGRPFFVMELVKGVSITEFCDAQKLSTGERLGLFVDVCRAVQHAHQKGIIHRDLKPSNVMITMHDDKPVVKVIDFGVAKALSQKLTEKTVYTAYNQLLGTPLYMAPEQAQLSGLDVDTRSDVYSLGVLLYELLTGTTPFEPETLRSAGFDELRQIICEQEPLRPSARVSTIEKNRLSTICDQRQVDQRELRQSLQGELDWVVMKALEKDRNRRYESVSALARDVTSYLEDKPVEACPPSAFYRLRKHARRHKGLLTSAALMTAILLVATGVSLVYAVQANEAREQAEREQGKALAAQEKSAENFAAALDAIDKLLQHASSEELAEVPQSQLIRKLMLEDVLEFYGQFKLTTGDSPQLRYRAANTWMDLAFLSRNLYEQRHAIEASNQSIALLRQLTADDPENVDFQKAYVEAFTAGARFHGYFVEDFDAATHHLNQAEERIEEQLQRDSRNAKDWLNLKLDLLCLMADLAVYGGDVGAQIRHARAAYQLLEEHELDKSHPVLGGHVKFTLAEALKHSDPDRAAELFQESLDTNSTLSPQDAGREHVRLHEQKLRKAGSFFVDRDPRLAFEYFTKAIALSERLVGEFPSLAMYQTQLLRGRRGYSKLLGNESIDLDTRLEWSKQFVTRCPDLSTPHAARAELLNKCENPVAELTKAIREYPRVADYYVQRAAAYHTRGETELALADLDLTRELQQPKDMFFFHTRTELLTKLKQFERALADYNRFVEMGNSADAFFARGGFFLDHIKDYERALDDFDRALEMRQGGHWFKHRALAHFHLGNYDDALADIKRAVELKPTDGSNFYWIPPDLVAKCPDESFRDALLSLADSTVKQHVSVFNHIGRGALLLGIGRGDEALADFMTAVELEPESYRYYQAALAHAAVGQQQTYRDLCRRMLSAPFASLDNKDPTEVHFVAWTCALAPDAVEDYEMAVQLARRAVSLKPENQQFLGGLGAILMRAGHVEDAKQTLIGALEVTDHENTSTAYLRYFLALTEHHLGNREESAKQLVQANRQAEEELQQSVPWNRRLTLELLRQEAEALI